MAKVIVIWKYPVGADNFSLEMPEGAQVLDVQFQRNAVQMWALVDPTAKKVTRHFVTYGTGHQVVASGELSYIGTFQSSDWLVFHLFERDLRLEEPIRKK